MTYVYDIILNYNDSNRVYEFFEWSNEDVLDHIKKIPLYRVNSDFIYDFINNNIKIDKLFLNEIKDKTLIYNSKNSIIYSCLFSDNNRTLAVEFDDTGNSIFKSFLMLDEEDDVNDISYSLDVSDIKYEILSKNDIDYYLTRDEIYKKKYLIKEINNLYKNKKIDKFNYLYEEIFNNDKLCFSDKYKRIISDLMNNYDYRYNSLYDIVKLSYIKK